MSDEFCKKLNEDSHKHATLPEHQRFGVHFDYQDLVNRLNKVKKEQERKTVNSSLDIRHKHQVTPLATQRAKKKSLTNIYKEKPIRNASETGLPNVKTPRPKIKTKILIPAQSESNLRVEKLRKDLKFHPLAKRPSVHF